MYLNVTKMKMLNTYLTIAVIIRTKAPRIMRIVCTKSVHITAERPVFENLGKCFLSSSIFTSANGEDAGNGKKDQDCQVEPAFTYLSDLWIFR